MQCLNSNKSSYCFRQGRYRLTATTSKPAIAIVLFCVQMVQGQLDDSTEFGDLLELQEQIRALQRELAEVKQADDEEIEKLLDQNGMACMYYAMLDTCTLCRASDDGL